MVLSLFYQENYHENWYYKQTIILLDTWPGLSTFVEIEALNAPTAYQRIFACTFL